MSDGVLGPEASVDLLHRMLMLPSPSGHEARLAEFLAAAMTDRGLKADIDWAGNVIGETGSGRGPTVLMLGHLDTVPGEVPVRSGDGTLSGRGAVDAKSALAAMVVAAAHTLDFPGRLIVAGVVEEETPESRGAEYLARTLERPGLVLIGEPSGWSDVVMGYKGKVDLRYRVRRPAAHPAGPSEKAVEVAAAFWAAARALADPGNGHTRFGASAVTLVSMRGDQVAAEMEISYRTPTGFDIDALVDRLASRCGDGELSLLNAVPAVLADRRAPLARALRAGIRGAGGNPGAKVKTGTSDMNTLAVHWDVPMAAYGPGDSRLDHADDEHIEVSEYLRSISVLVNALRELSRRDGGDR